MKEGLEGRIIRRGDRGAIVLGGRGVEGRRLLLAFRDETMSTCNNTS